MNSTTQKVFLQELSLIHFSCIINSMKRHFFWIAELFIWLLILITISGGIMFAKYVYKKSFNTYQIFLPDVDGLINGSPVRFLGIQVGYVNQVDIVGEEVYVKFIVTEKGVKIPRGSAVTVEFSGLGGSKSLEIYPPKPGNKIPSENVVIPQSPKRIHDSLGLLSQMFEKIIDITYTVSSFMNQVGIIENEDKSRSSLNKTSAQKILDQSNDWLDRAQKQVDKNIKSLDKKKNKEVKSEQR